MARLVFTFSSEFIGSLITLPKPVQNKFVKCLDLFIRNRRHPGLNVEPLRGRAKGLWSARLDLQYRLIFAEPSENEASLLTVGTEEDTYRYAERAGPGGGAPTIPVEPSQLRQLAAPRTRKYLPLAKFLADQPEVVNRLDLVFADIERIIGSKLPPSAYKFPAWWANDRKRHVQASSWLSVGWRTAHTRVQEQHVSFVRAS